MSIQNSNEISDMKVMLVKGEEGSNIASVEKTGTSGLVDTYTITMTDGTTQTFTVTNGDSISTIAKTSTVGTVDTYTITLTNGNTQTFTIQNGSDVSPVWEAMGIMGGKNFFQYPYFGMASTSGGLTITDNGDGTLTVVNDGTGYGSLYLSSIVGEWSDQEPEPGQDVIISCEGANANTELTVNSYYELYHYNSLADITDSSEYPVTIPNNKAWIGAYFTFTSGTAFTTTLKPMMRLAGDTDSTYRPFAYSNKNLSKRIDAINGYWIQKTVAAGETSATFYHSKITYNSGFYRFYSSNSSGIPVVINSVETASGQITLYFGALEETTDFAVQLFDFD